MKSEISSKLVSVNLIIAVCVFQCVRYCTSIKYCNIYDTTNTSQVLSVSKIIHSSINSFGDSKSSSPIFFMRKAMSISTYHYQSDILDESLKLIDRNRSINMNSIEGDYVLRTNKVRRFYNVILVDDYNSFR